MDEEKLYIGDKARMLRDIKGISQEAIAVGLGISQQAYHKMESGATLVSIEKAVLVSRLLGMDFNAMFNFSPTNYVQLCTQLGLKNSNNNGHEVLIETLKRQIAHLENEVEFLREELCVRRVNH